MRILVLGAVASGKQHAAKLLKGKTDYQGKIKDITDILYTTDESGMYELSDEDKAAKIEKLSQEESWIIEGTYKRGCKGLLDAAEKIYFIDLPLRERKKEIILRTRKLFFQFHHDRLKRAKREYDAMMGRTEHFEHHKDEIMSLLHKYDGKLTIVKNAEEVLDKC